MELNRTFSYSKSVGNASSYSAYVNGQLNVFNRSQLEVNANAQATAGGSLVGYQQQLLNLQSNASAGVLNGAHADVTVSVLGATVFNKNWDANQVSVSRTPFKKTFDKAYNGQVVIAAIPIAYTVGVAGSAGLEMTFNLSTPPSASVVVTPQVSATTYARLGVGISCCLSAGLGANLKLIEEQLPMTAKVKLQPDPTRVNPSWGIGFNANVTNNLTLLSGEIYAYLKIKVLFVKKTFTKSLFKWGGFKIKNTLFDAKAWVPINQPFPKLTGLLPASARAGSTGFTLTVNGSGFTNLSTVLWNNTPMTTTFVNASRLTVSIPANLLVSTTPTNATVKVQNAGNFPGVSSNVSFRITVPSPTLTSLNPGSLTSGATTPVTLNLTGTEMVAGSTVYWNTTPLTTTFVSAVAAQATVPVNLMSTPGKARITYKTPSGATSNGLTLQVFDSTPSITTIQPSSVSTGSSAVNMTVTGAGFVQTSKVYFSGTPLQTTFQSSTTLVGAVPANLLATAALKVVTVVTPGRAPSNAAGFSIGGVPAYTATEMPAILTYPNLVPTDVNNLGTVSGFVSQSASTGFDPAAYPRKGFVWFASNRNFPLTVSDGDDGFVPGKPTNYSGGANSICTAVQPNADAAVCFNTSTNAAFVKGQYIGFGLGNYYNNNYAFFSGINANGIAIGYSADGNFRPIFSLPNAATPAFVSGSPMTGIPGWAYNYTITPAAKSSPLETAGVRAISINDSNDVLLLDGRYFIGGGGAAQTLSNGGLGTDIYATGWNNSRTAVGVILSGTNFGSLSGQVAVRWTGGVPQALNFGGGVPLRINDAGDIVGENSSQRGVLLTGGTLYDLNTLITNTVNGTIGTAVAISGNGNIVAALYRTNGTVGTVLLTRNSAGASSTSLMSQRTFEPMANREAVRTARITPYTTDSILTLQSTSPAMVNAGTADFQLVATGSGYEDGAVLYWDDTPLATTFNSATQLTATVPAALAAQGGSISLVAVNPGGSSSTSLVFSVNNVTPTLDTVSPSQILAGTTGVTLIVNGTGFVADSIVDWSGTALTTTYVSPTKLTATIPDALLLATGTAAVSVINPDPGSTTSTAVAVSIAGPQPVLSSLSTTTAVAGAPNLTLSLTGSGFDATSVVLWDGNPLATTYVSPTMLTTVVPASYLAAPDAVLVEVTDSAPDSGTSAPIEFEITNPQPVLTSATPTSIVEGASSQSITITGSGFVSGSQANLNGISVPTTYLSATQLRVDLGAPEIAVAAAGSTASLTVANASTGATLESNSITLTVTPAPAVGNVSPAFVRTGSGSTKITVTGTGFLPQSTVAINGVALSTSYVSGTQLQATVPPSSLSTAGDYPLVVFQGSASDPAVGASDPVAFTVSDNAPAVPVITSLSPISAVAGSGDLGITINGTGFNGSTKGLWNGSTVLSIAYVTPTQIILLVPGNLLASPGTATIRLQNPADNLGQGGGTSNSANFNILSSAGTSVQIAATNLMGRDGNNNITVQVTLTNNGASPAANVVLTGARIGAVSATGLPVSVGTIMPNSSTMVLVTVPASAGATGAASSLSLNGTYTGGSFTATARITLP